MSRRKPQSILTPIQDQVRNLIVEKYGTVEKFCWDKDLNKATLSNFLANKKDFQISTIVKIVTALDKKLTIKLE